ncbi:MAG TPA: hypothetical protein VHC48_08810, partial [Puia sp.]|nr:hypothetical protein [Puia sp.]
HLESIEIYTVRENVNLVDVLKAMEASSERLPDDKDNAALKAYFTKVYPDLDFARVYSSDLKKMVKWFSVLKANDIEIKLSEAPVEEEAGEEVETAEVEKAPAKAKKENAEEKAPPKAKKEEEKAPAKEKKAVKKVEEEEEKPKKAAPKKKAEKEEKAAPKKKQAEEKPKKAAKKK